MDRKSIWELSVQTTVSALGIWSMSWCRTSEGFTLQVVSYADVLITWVLEFSNYYLFCLYDASCGWPRTNKRVGWSHWSGLANQGSPVGWGGGLCSPYLLLIEGKIPQYCERRCGRRWRALKRFTRTRPAIVHRWPLAELSHHQLAPAEMAEGGGSAYLKLQ